MNPLKSDNGSVGELGTTGMSTPQSPVSPSSMQPSTQPTSTMSSGSSEPHSTSTMSDIKLFYFNKPPDGERKSPTPISLSNGVGSKLVHLPASANNPSGYAYLGTLIKPGKEASEGQKVLLTPVIKERGRFILPRSAMQPNSGRPVSSSGTATSPPANIFLSPQSQQSKRILIHNSSISNKDLVSKGIVDIGTVVPKVLPPPKVPLVVCSSRPHDVTLTSIKPIAPKDDSTKQILDVPVMRSLVTKESPPSPEESTSESLNSENSDVTLTTITVPPLIPFNQLQVDQIKSPPEPPGDDVEIIGECLELPRPIVCKPSRKSPESTTSSSPTTISNSAVTVTSFSHNRQSPVTVTTTLSPTNETSKNNDSDSSNNSIEMKSKVDSTISQPCDNDNNNDTVNLNEAEATSKRLKSLLKASCGNIIIKNSTIENNENTSPTDKTESTQEKGAKSPNEPTIITDPSVVILKAKSNFAGIKMSGTNGHFVRILSSPNSENIFFKDGKSVVLGPLSKDINNGKDQQNKEVSEDGAKKEKEVSSSTDLGDDQAKEQMLSAASKLIQKNFSIRIPSSLDISSKISQQPGVTVNQIKTPSSQTGSGMLQIKEVCKDGAMMERSRKRKGTPLLRDCFKKTIAVKRLEALPGAMSVDPLQVIEWSPESGVGTLPGSEIKFIMNSYGAIQVYEGEGNKTNDVKPVGGVDVVYCANESKDDIGRCIECDCYGLLVEFIEEKFCSTSCKERCQLRQALISKRSIPLSTKETNKKRKLLEMALNKSRPSDEKEAEKEGIPKDNNNLPKLLPKSESKVNNTVTTSESKSSKQESKTNPSKTEGKTVQSQKLTVVPVMVFDSKSAALSKNMSDSSATTESASQKTDSTQSISKVAKHMESFRAIAPKPDLCKDSPTKPSISDDKKSILVKQVVEKIELAVTSAASSSSDNAERKPTNFDWCEYLSQMRSHPVWVRLFKDAFPSQPNLFKIGYRLEAIDPQRPSLFCAASVVQVKGYRLKLHFDGYPKTHDFWVNADSPNIFPCGFCKSHGIELEPPWGFVSETFTWGVYLVNIRAKPAPPKCFIHKQIDSGEPNLFKVGMKLEAIDKKNSYLVCVATVAGVVDHRILVHFDSWDESYDYWTEYYSPNIHPVGWCQRNNYTLTPPNGNKKRNFVWKRYLIDTKSVAAPESAFMVRPPTKFKKGSKLEAIDPRSPHLLRVATIKQVLPYQVYVVFDGFPDHFGYWFDDDSPDLHPVGWGKRTGHPLTPPPMPETVRKCSTAGCLGDGNASSGDLETHNTVDDCPYSIENLEDDDLLPDRLNQRSSQRKGMNRDQMQGMNFRKESTSLQRSRKSRESMESMAATPGESPASSRVASPTSEILPTSTHSTPTTLSITSSEQNQTNSKPSTPITLTEPSRSLPSPSSKSTLQDDDGVKEAELDAAFDKFVSKSSHGVSSTVKIDAFNILEWDSRKVTAFVESILHKATNTFYNNKVDGEGFLMLSEEDLSKRLSFSQIEASFIYSNIVMLRTKFRSI